MRYSTVGLIVLLTLGMLAAPRMSAAQQPAQQPRIGVLVMYITFSMHVLVRPSRPFGEGCTSMAGWRTRISRWSTDRQKAEGRTTA